MYDIWKYNMSMKIQQFCQQGQNQHIPNLEAVKAILQEDIVRTEIQLQLKRAQGKKRGARLVSGIGYSLPGALYWESH